jgi:hypothetical protein
MKKHNLTTAIRLSTLEVIKAHADNRRAIGRFLDELIQKALEHGLIPARKEGEK